MTPEETAAHLSEIAYLLRQSGDQHRARAFTRVANVVLRDRPDLATLHAAGQLATVEGAGTTIARTLAELVETGGSKYLERLRAERSAVQEEPAKFEISPLTQMGYRGDLHSHTDWSDGRASVMEMALAARARGYEYLAITDHSPRITVVNGLGPERLAAQRRLIDEANAELGGSFTLLQGVEVDINEDGTLDEPDETLAQLDIVIASPHMKLRMDKAEMTERMLAAVEHPHVDVIGHPTGRRPGSRAGAEYDFEAVFAAAAARGVVMEIDCDPARMDLSPELARLAASLGCRFSLDSDAHAPDQLLYVDLGIWMARRAGVEFDRLVNWLPLADLKEVFA